MNKNNLMKGAFILSFGGVMAKVFSAVYRIVITRILGGAGIGLYQLIFPFYSLCVVISTAGVPMAISKIISKHNQNESSILKKCLLFILTISSIAMFILVISAKSLALLQGEKELTFCYLILAPSVIFAGVASVLRGYFQGKNNFTPSATANICEQFVKMIVGLVLSSVLIKFGLIAGIVGAIMAIVISEIVSLAILIIYLKKYRLKKDNKTELKVKDLIKDIIPITLINIILPVSAFIDSVLIVNLLEVNFSGGMPVFLFGLESGAVSSLISIPTIFSFAIASVILPNLTTSKKNFNKNLKLTFAVKLVLIITIPCVLVFLLVPNRLIDFLYFNKLNAYGIDGSAIASRLLTISSLGVTFFAINQVYSSSLQAVDERFVAVRNLIIGVILKFIFELVLVPNKLFNIYALAIANTICYVMVMVLNHLEIKANFNLKIGYEFWAKLVFSNSLMIISMVLVMSIGTGSANTVLAGVVSVIAYFIGLMITKIFTPKEKAMFKYKV